MKKQLTLEQKAKRYDYFEKAILDYFKKRIDDIQYDDDVSTSTAIDDVLDKIDDVMPTEVYMLIDKVLDENYGCFQSQKRCCIEYLKKRYAEFEEKIGG